MTNDAAHTHPTSGESFWVGDVIFIGLGLKNAMLAQLKAVIALAPVNQSKMSNLVINRPVRGRKMRRELPLVHDFVVHKNQVEWKRPFRPNRS
jgi:hypothetical protein